MTVAAPERDVPVSVRFSIAARDSAVAPSAVDKVAELVLQVFIVLEPAMASSIILVTLLFTKSPHVPASSP